MGQKDYRVKIAEEFRSIYNKKYLVMPKTNVKPEGFSLKGKTIRTIIYSTDLVVVRNSNADASMIVYPFTPEPVIVESFIRVAHNPVFVGVGGGATQSQRIAHFALNAEFMGALAVIVNSPILSDDLKIVVDTVDIPVIATLVSAKQAKEKIEAGAQVLNVAAADHTPKVVRRIRDNFDDIPIIATGGKTQKSIDRTIVAGANAITYVAPSIRDLMSDLMDKYRGLV